MLWELIIRGGQKSAWGYWLPSRGLAEQRVSFYCPPCSQTWLINVLHAFKQNQNLPVVYEYMYAGIQDYM